MFVIGFLLSRVFETKYFRTVVVAKRLYLEVVGSTPIGCWTLFLFLLIVFLSKIQRMRLIMCSRRENKKCNPRCAAWCKTG